VGLRRLHDCLHDFELSFEGFWGLLGAPVITSVFFGLRSRLRLRIEFRYSRTIVLRDELVPLPLYIYQSVHSIEMALDSIGFSFA
jgi:hypothetical protein